MKLAATNLKDIFGTVSPPPGSEFANKPNPLGNLIVVGIQLFLLLAALATLLYLFWGAFDWITGGGDKEKISKAQSKIQNAVIGLLLVVISLAVFQVLAGTVLHIIEVPKSGGGWIFKLPSL